MNTVYVVIPFTLLVAFASYVVPASTRLDAELATRAAAKEQQLAKERREQEQRLAVATAEQRERRARKIREQAEKERVQREAQEQRDQELSDRVVQARAVRDALRAEITTLETKLQYVRSRRAHGETMLHAARAALETRLIARRNADLELQRMTLLLAELVDRSVDAGLPIFPAPAGP